MIEKHKREPEEDQATEKIWGYGLGKVPIRV